MYHIHQACLPFFMLLDMVQQMYLSMVNSADPAQSVTFYEGVEFINSLRQNVMASLQNREDPPPLTKSLLESMQR